MMFLGSSSPVSEEGIIAVERALGVTLPPGYRGFLLKHNGGHPDKPVFTVAETGAFGVIQNLFCVNADSRDDLIKAHKRYHARLPKSVLSVGCDPGGNLIVIGVSGLLVGRVFFWDHEAEGIAAGADALGNLALIADSWEVFLGGLLADD